MVVNSKQSIRAGRKVEWSELPGLTLIRAGMPLELVREKFQELGEWGKMKLRKYQEEYSCWIWYGK